MPGQEARARPISAIRATRRCRHGATADPGRDHRGADLRRRAAGAAPLGRAAGRGRRGLPRDARDHGQDPGHLLGHGHRDREPARHRHGAGRRHRRHPPQHDAGGAGRAGGGRQALRRRHGGQPRHHPSRRHARRCPAADGRAPHLRHSRGGARQEGQAGRHPHQPRRALRHQPDDAGGRADDQEAGHGEGGGEPRGRAAAAASAQDREAAGGGRGLPLHRPGHGQGHREGPEIPQRIQGRARPAAGGGGDQRRRGRLPAHRAP